MSDTPRTAHALKYADSIADMGEWMGALERELAALAAAPAAPQSQEPGDPMDNWLMKPCLEWLEQAEHGENKQRCQMIADILRDLWRRQKPPEGIDGLAAPGSRDVQFLPGGGPFPVRVVGSVSAPQSGWVSVEERLPTDTKTVLTNSNAEGIKLGMYCEGYWWSGNEEFPMTEVTHWMPLPAAPGREG